MRVSRRSLGNDSDLVILDRLDERFRELLDVPGWEKKAANCANSVNSRLDPVGSGP